MSKVVRMLVREMLTEMQAYKRVTGKRYTADVDAFRDTVGKPGYYLHLSDSPKIGVRPQSGFLQGLYLYPHTKENYESIMLGGYSGDIVAGRAARYAFLVKLRDDVKLVKKDNLNDYINERYDAAVIPVLDSLLDTRLMSDEENAGKYYGKSGKFMKQFNQSSIVPVLKVTPDALERAGDDSIERNVKKILELVYEIKELVNLKGKARAERVPEMNERIHKLMDDVGLWSRVENGVPEVFELGGRGRSWETVGLKLTKTGVLTSNAIIESSENILSLARRFSKFDEDQKKYFYSQEVTKGLSKVPTGWYDAGYSHEKLFKAIAEKYKQTASFYYNVARAGGADTRWAAVSFLLKAEKSSDALVGKDGNNVSMREVAGKLVDSLLAAMSYPGKQMTREALKKHNGPEEINILLAIGGDDSDGVEDSGFMQSADSNRTVGSLGIEGKQTFIKPPIASKFEGGGPIMMIDRMEGLAPDKTPTGSVHGTAHQLYQDKSPREMELSNRRVPSDSERFRAKKAGVDIPKGRERYAGVRDYKV